MKREDICQAILDSAMAFCDDHLKEDNGTFEGSMDFDHQGHFIHIKVVRKKPEEVFENKAKERTIKRTSTPFLMANLWGSLYGKIVNVPYGPPQGRDLGIIKQLLNQYDADQLEIMMRWYLKNYMDLPKHSEIPSLPGLSGYRDTVAFKCFSKEKKDEAEDSGIGAKL